MVTCSDDGRGLDSGAAPRARRGPRSATGRRRRRGDASAARRRPVDEPRRDEVAGRGVGLDVVREVAEQLNGEVAIHSVPDEGTRLVLVVPVSLSSLPRAGGRGPRDPGPGPARRRPAGGPARAVRRVAGRERRAGPDRRRRAALRPRCRRCCSPARPSRRPASTAVVIDAGGRMRRRSASTGSTRSPPSCCGACPPGCDVAPVVGGVVLGEDGRPRLVLLPRRWSTPPAGRPAAPPAPSRRRCRSWWSTTRSPPGCSSRASSSRPATRSTSPSPARRPPAGPRAAVRAVPGRRRDARAWTASSSSSRPAPTRLCATSRRSSSPPATRPRTGRAAQEVGARGYIVKSEFDQQALLRSHPRSWWADADDPRARGRRGLADGARGTWSRCCPTAPGDRGRRRGRATASRPIELCEQLRPDVITMDMMLPVMTGLAATEYIMAHCPTPILVVSASVNRGELFRTYDALAAGAVDVLEKPLGDEPRRRLGAAASSPRCGWSPGSGSSPTRGPGSPALDGGARPRPAPVRERGTRRGGRDRRVDRRPGAVVDVLRELPGGLRACRSCSSSTSASRSRRRSPTGSTSQTALRVRYAVDGEPLPDAGGSLMAPPGPPPGSSRRTAAPHDGPGAPLLPPVGRRAVRVARRASSAPRPSAACSPAWAATARPGCSRSAAPAAHHRPGRGELGGLRHAARGRRCSAPPTQSCR